MAHAVVVRGRLVISTKLQGLDILAEILFVKLNQCLVGIFHGGRHQLAMQVQATIQYDGEIVERVLQESDTVSVFILARVFGISEKGSVLTHPSIDR